MLVEQTLDSIDMTNPFIILSVLGAALCMYVMQKTWHDQVATLDPPVLRWLRRLAMAIVALSLCWAVMFLLRTHWRPWPPVVGIVAALDFLFAVRAVTLMWRSLPGRELERRARWNFALPHKTQIR